jgi:GAF domain-containing protein
MSENFIKATGNKQQQYNNLLPQIAGIVEGETDLIANLANITAMLKEQFNWLWVGFYWVKENMLVLGPFQGPIACTRIQKGKGVCGTAWQQANTVIVPDVNAFPGHIACSSLSQSEIVVPIIHKDEVVGVLDVEADTVNQFDETDKLYLEQIVQLIPLP